jgi:hypothetical protein
MDLVLASGRVDVMDACHASFEYKSWLAGNFERACLMALKAPLPSVVLEALWRTADGLRLDTVAEFAVVLSEWLEERVRLAAKLL